MNNYRRTLHQHKYHTLDIFECPTDVILQSAALGSEWVTVENYTHFGKSQPPEIEFNAPEGSVAPALLRYAIDFRITREEFISMKSVWHSNGCYAVFHSQAEIPFKISAMPEGARYKALDNFNWNLEVAVPGSASDGWSRITSPVSEIIDRIELLLK